MKQMTDREFEEEYKGYDTLDADEAKAEAADIRLSKGQKPVVLKLRFHLAPRYTIMTPEAAGRAIEDGAELVE